MPQEGLSVQGTVGERHSCLWSSSSQPSASMVCKQDLFSSFEKGIMRQKSGNSSAVTQERCAAGTALWFDSPIGRWKGWPLILLSSLPPVKGEGKPLRSEICFKTVTSSQTITPPCAAIYREHLLCAGYQPSYMRCLPSLLQR